jgi:cbb3-type cytochrome oxidase subunit 3
MGYKIGVTLFFIAFFIWAMRHAEKQRKENERK